MPLILYVLPSSSTCAVVNTFTLIECLKPTPTWAASQKVQVESFLEFTDQRHAETPHIRHECYATHPIPSPWLSHINNIMLTRSRYLISWILSAGTSLWNLFPNSCRPKLYPFVFTNKSRQCRTLTNKSGTIFFPVHKHHRKLQPSRCISKSPQVTSTMRCMCSIYLSHRILPHPFLAIHVPTPPSPTSVCAVAETKPLVDMKITAAIPSNIQYISSLIPTGLAIDNRKQTAFAMQGEEMNVSCNTAHFSLMHSFVHTTNRWH